LGILMHFYAGDADRIGQACTANDSLLLRDSPILVADADFSLHLSPIDLDCLSEATCSLVGHPPMTLTDSLIRRVGGDGRDRSAEVVSSEWVEMMASVPDDQVAELASLWMARVAKEHAEEQRKPTVDSIRGM
jgi:hypothetical protein